MAFCLRFVEYENMENVTFILGVIRNSNYESGIENRASYLCLNHGA